MSMLTEIPEGAKLFAVTLHDAPPAATGQDVLVCGGEKGGVDALLPTMQEVLSRGIGVTALFSDAGLRTFSSVANRYGLVGQDITDRPADNQTPPAGLLFSPSPNGAVEQAISQFDAPWTVVEDYYVSSRNIVSLALSKGLSPPTVCVIDTQAQDLLAERFPGVSIPTEITGSPAFDILHGEDVAAQQQHIKNELGISDKKLVAIMLPYLGNTSLAEAIAAACQDFDDDVMFTIKCHPRDENSHTTYENIFRNVQTLSMDQAKGLSVAADIVITQRSTYSLTAVTRQQLNIALTDDVPAGFTLPTVDTGASLASSADGLAGAMAELLDGQSERCASLRRNMLPYVADGKSAARVTDVICRQLIS